jgi:hypothetical protein
LENNFKVHSTRENEREKNWIKNKGLRQGEPLKHQSGEPQKGLQKYHYLSVA